MNTTQQKPKQIKHSDFIIQETGCNIINLKFLMNKGIFLSPDEGRTLSRLMFFEKGEQIPNKIGANTYLPPIGVALYDFTIGSAMMGNNERSAMGKSIFKKFYPDKFDLFF